MSALTCLIAARALAATVSSGLERYVTDLNLTIIGVLICALGAAFSFRRNFTPGRNFAHRRINWMIVSLGFIAVGFVLFVHLVNIAGIETGRR